MRKVVVIQFRLISLVLFFFFISHIFRVENTFAQTGCSEVPTSTITITTTVNISANGTYKIWSRLMAPDTVNNSLFLQIDDGCAINIGDSDSVQPNIWNWIDYKNGDTADKNTVTLTTGTHTIKLTQREGEVSIDRLLFVQDQICVPTGIGNTGCPGPSATPTTSPASSQSTSSSSSSADIPNAPPAVGKAEEFAHYKRLY